MIDATHCHETKNVTHNVTLSSMVTTDKRFQRRFHSKVAWFSFEITLLIDVKKLSILQVYQTNYVDLSYVRLEVVSFLLSSLVANDIFNLTWNKILFFHSY